MLDVDAVLTTRGVGIPQRPLHAVMEIAARFGIPLPISGRRNINGPAFANSDKADRIHQWYKTRYGSSLNIDPCPGRFFTSINGDLWG